MQRDGKVLPVSLMVLAIILLWYIMAVVLNTPWQKDVYQRAEQTNVGMVQHIKDTWARERPVLPSPHQVATEIWNTTVEKKITSKRSLVYHAKITLSSSMLGFALGTVLGICLLYTSPSPRDS